MSWTPLGPRFVFAPKNQSFHRISRRNEYGEQGMVARVTIDPSDPGTIYTVHRPSNGGVGLYRSSSAGTPEEDWVSIIDSLQQANPDIDPACVAVNPVNNSTVFMGTWDDQSIFISNDRGDSWAAPVKLGGSIRKIVIDPRTAGNASATVLFAATDKGLFRSADSGSSWNNVLPGDIWSFCASMPAGGPDAYYAGMYQSGLYTAANPTGTWTNLNDAGIGLPPYDASAPGGENFNVVYTDLCPLNPSRLYLVLLNGQGTNFSALYTTGSPTTSWTQVALGASKPDPYPGALTGFYRLVYDFAFAVAPNSPGDGVNDILFFANITFWRSQDGGVNWTTPPKVLHGDHHDFAFYPPAPPAGTVPQVYFATDGGLGMSTQFCDPNVDITVAPPDNDELDSYANTGVVQNFNRGIPSLATYAYASHPALPALQYAAMTDTGLAGGTKTNVWRSFFEADALQIAIAPGADGVKVWHDEGPIVGGAWPFSPMSLFTDQGGDPMLGVQVTSPSGARVEATSRFVVTPDGRCLFGMQSIDMKTPLPPDPSNPFRSTVGLVDQFGNATRISQVFGSGNAGPYVECVCVGPSGNDVGYCATDDNRLWTTPSVKAADATTVWTEITASKPAGISIASIIVDAAGSVYLLGSSPVPTAAVTTPLFAVGGGVWTPQQCNGVPTGVSLGQLLADPVSPGVLYASAGSRIYRITLTGGTWIWQDISDDLPGQPINDMWIGNIGTAAKPQVLLRVAISTRGIWELDVASPPGPLSIRLFMRDTMIDQGLLVPSPDLVPSPYAPADYPNQGVFHWESPDIKVDAIQSPGGGNPDFFQADPEGGNPISSIAFGCIKDNSQNLLMSDAARVYVQVNNRSRVPASNVYVWAVFAPAAGHPPALNTSMVLGNNFAFWKQFVAGVGGASIKPNLPSDSPWTAIGPVITLQGVDAEHPKVASWNWTVPTLSSGDKGHYCMVAFVHSAQDPLIENGYDVDTVTPNNRLVAQKNLHVVTTPGMGPVPPHAPIVMREFIEFNNPYAGIETFEILFDFRSLPRELEVQLQFTPLETREPLERAMAGIQSSRKGTLVPSPERPVNRPGVIRLPEFVDSIHMARPSALVTVRDVKIPAFRHAAAYLVITQKGRLAPGSEHRFVVQQKSRRHAVGGSTYVLRIGSNPKQEP